eukprot:TRINITY_DN68347_c0_g1_i1.p1 TRINITY_DN68347_c0_g1~~TRINITY_DN68347_c0_g1_i1.p1  ORF type:complete len:250 (+),score=44.09 TRINITY_DN68347_c0_g1_i1:70-819(+)
MTTASPCMAFRSRPHSAPVALRPVSPACSSTAAARGFGGARAQSRPCSAQAQAPRAPPSRGLTGLGGRGERHAKSPFYELRFCQAYEQIERQRELDKIAVLFEEGDVDGSGDLSIQEFRDALRTPEMRRCFAAVGVQPHQCDKIFMCLDSDCSGSLSRAEFMSGVRNLIAANTVNGITREFDVSQLRASNLAKVMQQGEALRKAVVPPNEDFSLPRHELVRKAIRQALAPPVLTSSKRASSARAARRRC